MRPAALSATVATAVAIAGCGGSGHGGAASSRSSGAASSSTATGTTATGTTATGTTTARRRSPGRSTVHVPAGPPLGHTQGVHAFGADLTVTATRVLDLTRTATPALSGTREVGVLIRIADRSGATYDSTASGDISVVVSSGQAVPMSIRAGICQTPLVDFESLIGAGDVRSGCVGFSVPRRARVLAVRFSPHAQARHGVVWRSS